MRRRVMAALVGLALGTVGCGAPAAPAMPLPAAPMGLLSVTPELDGALSSAELSLYRRSPDGGPDALVAVRSVQRPIAGPIHFTGLTPGVSYRLTASEPAGRPVTELRFELPDTPLTLSVPISVTTGPDRGLAVTNGTIVDTDEPERIE